MAVLLLVSLGTALYSSLAIHPYSLTSPKRTAITHLILTQQDGSLDGTVHTCTSVGQVPGSAHQSGSTLDPVMADRMHDMAEAALFSVDDGERTKGGGGGRGGGGQQDEVPDPEMLRDQAEAAAVLGVNGASSLHGEKETAATQCLSGQAPRMIVSSTRISFASTDSVPIGFALSNSSPSSPSYSSSSDDGSMPSPVWDQVETNGREFTSVFPVSSLLKGTVHYERPASDPSSNGAAEGAGRWQPPLEQLPYICRTSEDETILLAAAPSSRASDGVLEQGSSRTVLRRFHLRAFTERPAWGILNVTSTASWVVRGWSFGHQLMPSLIGEKVSRGEAGRAEAQHLVVFLCLGIAIGGGRAYHLHAICS